MSVFKKALIIFAGYLFINNNLWATEIFKTDEELIVTVPITNNYRVPYVYYSIGPLDLEEGNIIDIRVQAVLSTECENNTGIGRYIIRTKERFSIQGKRVVKTVMSNSTSMDHHIVLVHSGIEVIEESSVNNYYNFAVFAQSTKCQGQTLKVEGYDNEGFGELILLKN